LAIQTTEFSELCFLVFPLDALSDDIQSKTLAKIEYRLDHCRVFRVRAKTPDETLVDFQAGYREALE
jgi:hypothetical protein